MQQLKGTVLHCGRFGCIVRLEDGRIGNLPTAEAARGAVRQAAARRKTVLLFQIVQEEGRLQLRLAEPDAAMHAQAVAANESALASTSLDQKIIDYLRQTEDWDPKGALASRAQETKPVRADRLLPFEARARKQYRDTPKKPPRKKR
jgi:hypothetical protein